MPDEIQQLKKRYIELSARASAQNRWTHTDFLSLAEQDVLYRITPAELSALFTLYGGFDGAERRVAAFGSEELCGYIEAPPITCIKIAPRAPKFAESLTHRDFLGALVGLGIERVRVLGDIVIQDAAAYLFCLDSIARVHHGKPHTGTPYKRHLCRAGRAARHYCGRTGRRERQCRVPERLGRARRRRVQALAQRRADAVRAGQDIRRRSARIESRTCAGRGRHRFCARLRTVYLRGCLASDA